MSLTEGRTKSFGAAKLQTISYAKLRESDTESIGDLLSAARQSGFFYLDLRDAADATNLLDNVERLYDVAVEVFDLEEQEKMRYDLDVIGPHKIFGYKPAGRNTGVSAKKQDGFEIYLVSKNQIDNLDSGERREIAKPLVEASGAVEAFAQKAHEIGIVLMQCLSKCLELPATAGFDTCHRLGKLSTSAVGLLKYPPTSILSEDRVGQIAHTDVGSITLLFSKLDGLQVLDPASEATAGQDVWGWIPPHPFHAVVNIGDSLRFLSGAMFNSSLHRVIPHPSAAEKARYSIAYFMRPEYDARFCDDQGTPWTGLSWHTRKFKVFRAPFEEQSKSAVLTGKNGYLGLWTDVDNGELAY